MNYVLFTPCPHVRVVWCVLGKYTKPCDLRLNSPKNSSEWTILLFIQPFLSYFYTSFSFLMKILVFVTFMWKLTVRKMAIVLSCVSHCQIDSIFHSFVSSSANLMKKIERWMIIFNVFKRFLLKYFLSVKIQQLFSWSIGEIFSACSTLNHDNFFAR